MPCHAMLCYAMLCYAMLCYATLCYAMLRYATLRYAPLCYAMLRYATLNCTILCCVYLKEQPNWDVPLPLRCLWAWQGSGLGLGVLDLCGVILVGGRVSVRSIRSVRASTPMTVSLRDGNCTVLKFMFGGRLSMLDLEMGSTVRPW